MRNPPPATRSSYLLVLVMGLALASPIAGESKAALLLTGRIERGVTHELVYKNNDILSELTWPQESALYLGAGGEFCLPARMRLSVEFSVFASDAQGTMIDSDYKNLPASGVKTHHSEHASSLRSGATLEAAAGIDLDLPLRGINTERRMTVRPEALVSFATRSWKAFDGYVQYGQQTGTTFEPWTPDLPRQELSGTVVTYNMTTLSLAGRLTLLAPVGHAFTLQASAAAGPVLFALGTDEHLLRYLVFRDYLNGGIFMEFSGGAAWRVTQRDELRLSLSCERIERLRGDTLISPSGATFYTVEKDAGGSNSLIFSASLTFALFL